MSATARSQMVGYGELPLRTRQAPLALLHAQSEGPGPKTTAEILERDYDSPSMRGTAAALSAARKAGVVDGVARRSGSPATHKTYAATYRQLVALAGPGAGAEILTEPFVAAFRDHLEQRGLSPATVARHLSAVRELVRAVGGPGAVDALAVKSSRVQKGEPRPLTEQQAKLLLAMPDRRTTRGIRDAAMLQLLVDAGVRREELVKLSVSSIEETDSTPPRCGRRSRRRPPGRCGSAASAARSAWCRSPPQRRRHYAPG